MIIHMQECVCVCVVAVWECNVSSMEQTVRHAAGPGELADLLMQDVSARFSDHAEKFSFFLLFISLKLCLLTLTLKFSLVFVSSTCTSGFSEVKALNRPSATVIFVFQLYYCEH